MATFFSNALVASTSTDAQFRAIVAFIHGALIGGGWVQTADAGQMDPATILHPTGGSQKMGYGIYRMNDALQATHPVFMRIDFGCSSTVNAPGIWITLGTGSNGAGVITGIFFNGGAAVAPTVTTAGGVDTVATNSYASADPSRIHMMLFVTRLMFFWSLERGKKLTGEDDGNLLYMTWGSGTGNIGAIDKTQCLVRTGGGSPPVENGATFVIANQNSSAFSSDIGIGLIVHFKGVAQPIGLGAICVDAGDFLSEAQIDMTVYGQTRHYVIHAFTGSCVYIPTGNGNSTLRLNTRVGIRYD